MANRERRPERNRRPPGQTMGYDELPFIPLESQTGRPAEPFGTFIPYDIDDDTHTRRRHSQNANEDQ